MASDREGASGSGLAGMSSEFSLSRSGSGELPSLAPVAVEQFDEYVLVGKLGHGGMAEVFLALASGPSGFKKLLVIKRVHGHMKDEPQLVQMFLDEARLAARLNHPNIVQTNKVGSFHGHHFLAMEFLDGQSINRVMKRGIDSEKPLPVALAARIVSDALEGLHYAHDATDFDGTRLEIVHRDVSPHNLFLTYEGQVKVLDFGIAKAATQESQTRTGIIKGKFAYIAPEQARGEPVDRRADVWSMGVTMWEMLAGRRLFRRATEVGVLHATLSDPIPFLTEIAPSVPRELATICDRALQRDAEERWPTALAMKDAIDEWLASTKGSTRGALGTYAKDLFVTEIEDQRARVRECIERVKSATGNFATISQVLPLAPEVGSPGATTRVERRGSAPRQSPFEAPAAPQPAESSTARRAMLAVASLLGVAALLLVGWWFGSRPNESASTEEPTVTVASLPTTVPIEPRAIEPAPSHEEPAIALAAPTAPAVDEALPEDPTTPDSARTPRPHRPTHATTPVPTTPVEAAPPSAPEPAPAPTPASGHLVLDATPYAIVSLEGRRLGITPIDVDLPAGTHTLSLRNPEQGIETTYRVTIRAGETVRRTVALE